MLTTLILVLDFQAIRINFGFATLVSQSKDLSGRNDKEYHLERINKLIIIHVSFGYTLTMHVVKCPKRVWSLHKVCTNQLLRFS